MSSPTTVTITSGTGGTGGSFAADNWGTITNSTSLSSSGIGAGIWLDPGAATGTNAVKVAANGTGTQSIMVIVEEWAGLAVTLAAIADASATPLHQSVASTTWSAGPTGTTAQASELVLGVTAAYTLGGAGPSLVTPGSPWTGTAQQSVTSAGHYIQALAAGYQVASATGAFTWAGTDAYLATACLVTLKASPPVLTAQLATAAAAAQPASPAPHTATAQLATAAAAAQPPGLATGQPPAVITEPASSITSTSAILNATVNPQGLATTWQFQYGTTTAYGTTVPVAPGSAGSGSVAVSQGYALAGLAAATTYHYRVVATSFAGTTYGNDQSLTTLAAATGVTFPGAGPNPLGFKAEINLNGSWVNITQYVLQRDQVQITNMGRADEATTISAAQAALTLRNTDGRFTPANAAGAYYPFILLNTQLRISLSVTSATSAYYAGYRFHGEIASWPPTSNPTAPGDIYIQVTASGIWRRISAMSATIGSAYTRYLGQLTGADVPAAAWPMEDGTAATAFIASIGSSAAATWSSAPSLASDSASFPGTDSLPQFNGARITANVTSAASPGSVAVRFALSVPAGGDSIATTFTAGGGLANILMPGGAGIKHIGISLEQNSTLQIQGFSAVSGGSVLFTGVISTPVAGIPVLVSAELTPAGSSVAWALRIIKPGASGVLDQVTGTQAGAGLAQVTQVMLSNQGRMGSSAFGELSVHYTVPSLVTAAAALSGWTGEYAAVRFTRLCAEFFIPSQVTGSAGAQMGPQADDTLPNLLQVIENTDGGLLYEPADMFGLGYRTLASLQNQSPAAVISYTAGQLGAQLVPTYDDQHLVNQVTVTNWDGYTALATLTSGARSIQPVPNGVGPYPGSPVSISAYTDTQANVIAQQKLFQGTVADLRYPTVTVNYLRSQAAPLLPAVPGLRIGDYLQVSNLPSFFGGGTASQLVWGWSETLNAFAWTTAYNTIPEAPFATGFSPGVYSVVQAPSGQGASGFSGGSGGISALAAELAALSAEAASATLSARSIGGITSYISATTPYDWTFTVSGVPANGTYFTATPAQAQPISVGDTFTNSGGFGGPFTVTSLHLSGGNVNVVYFTPDATSPMSSGIVYGGKNGDSWVNTAASNQIEQWQAGAWVPIQFGPGALSFTAGGAKVTIAPSGSPPSSPATGDIWYVSDQGYVMEQWNGSAWVPYQYGAGALSATARQLGGITTTVAASAPGGALAGDLWIDTAVGNAIYQYSGSTWTLYQFGSGSIAANSIAAAQITANTITASQIAAGTITTNEIAASTITSANIAAGTITASLIATGTITATQIAAGTITAANIASGTITATQMAAGTITASQIAAGTIIASNLTADIVVAGIVDATTVQAAEYIATSAQGEFLAYSSGSPGSGTLINSIAGAAGTDGSGNSYPQGLFSQQLTLNNQASGPATFSGASVFFSSVAGRPRYLASTGEDSIIERGSVNVSAFTVSNPTSAAQVSGTLSYYGTSAGNQSSTFELEVNGAFHTGTAAVQQVLFQLYVDGASFGNQLTIGAAAQNVNNWYAYSMRFRLSVLTSGSSGTAVVVIDGTMCEQAVVIGSVSNTMLSLGATTSSVAFDTTANHTLAVYGWFGGSQSGQQIDTYITRTTNYS